MSRMYPDPPCLFPSRDGEAKLRELMLHISEKCADDPSYGATKLNKILDVADQRSYVLYGTPITGVEYLALDKGPAPRRLLPIKQSMIEAHEIVEEKRVVGGYVQRRIVPLRKPNLSMLTGQDVAVVDAVIEEMWKKGGARVSKESHGRRWRIAHKAGVSIPYAAAFLTNEEVVRPEDKARAKELADRLSWSR